MKQNYQVNEQGFYGEFGGAFIPPALERCINELNENYTKIIKTPEFKTEFNHLLRDYVGRPTPLYLSPYLSKKHGCKIYLKREDLNHTGAHKINNTVGQVLVARFMGKKRIIAETGAGQHGVATATVCALMNMECVIYMGEVDIQRQYMNVQRMKMLGATIVPVTIGNKTLKEAVDVALQNWIERADDTFYLIGSTVGPHPYPDMVANFQSVISAEIQKQLLEQEGRDFPDYLIACVGGGSNAAGTVYHYLDNDKAKIILVEAAGKGIDTNMTAATMNLGLPGMIHGMHTLIMTNDDGTIQEPYSISAGLDYPGVGPLHAHLAQSKRATVVAISDTEALTAAFEITRNEGIIPALETAHTFAALDKLNGQFNATDVVVLTVSGRGDKDLQTYIDNM